MLTEVLETAHSFAHFAARFCAEADPLEISSGLLSSLGLKLTNANKRPIQPASSPV